MSAANSNCWHVVPLHSLVMSLSPALTALLPSSYFVVDLLLFDFRVFIPGMNTVKHARIPPAKFGSDGVGYNFQLHDSGVLV